MRWLALVLLLMGCNGPSHLDSEAARCYALGGEPVPVYTSYARGTIIGCSYTDVE